MVRSIARWGSEFVVGDGPALFAPSVAGLGVTDGIGGRFVVVYAQGTSDKAGVGDTEGIVGQLYNGDGTKNGAPFLVNSGTSDPQYYPAVIDRTDDQGFAVVWTDDAPKPDGGSVIRERLFDVNGQASAPDFVVSAFDPPFDTAFQPSIDRVGTFGTIAVSYDSPISQPDGKLNVEVGFYSNGTLINFDVAASAEAVDAPGQSHVTDLPETGFLVTWTGDIGNGSQLAGVGTNISGQLYSQLGVKIGLPFLIAEPGRDVSRSTATGFADGGYVVGWMQDDNPSDGGFDRNVYARFYGEDGTAGDPIRLSLESAGQQQNLALQAIGGDKVIAAWTGDESGNGRIHVRIFNEDGTPYSEEMLIQNTTGGTAAVFPAIAVLQEASGLRFVVSWRDNTNAQIRAQIFDLSVDADFVGSERGETYVARTAPSALYATDQVLIGNGGNDVLVGSRLADKLDGGTGNDRLDGGIGIDRMTGRAGNDTYLVDDARDVVVESANNGTDAVLATASYVLAAGVSVEVLNVADRASTKAINLTGNEFAQTLNGSAGNNILDGRGGADVMVGGGGNDTFAVDNAGDRVGETLGGGNDTVVSAVSWALKAGQEVETLQFAKGAASLPLNLEGNELANRLIGNNAGNTLRGGGGADTLVGGLSRDALYLGNDKARDTVAYGSAAESTSRGRDVVLEMHLNNEDRFDLPFMVGQVLKAGGMLRDASFDADLKAAVDGPLTPGGAIQAVLFDPIGGDLDRAGQLYLVIDANNDGAYDPSRDFVIQLQGATGTLDVNDFV